MIKSIGLLIFFLSFKADNSIAQSFQNNFSDSGLILQEFGKLEHKPLRYKLEKASPINIIFQAPLILYKTFLSEQISARCQFEPSCSAFSLQAIRKFGIVKGVLLTADRLTRCNGMAHEDCPDHLMDKEKNLVLDKPEFYK